MAGLTEMIFAHLLKTLVTEGVKAAWNAARRPERHALARAVEAAVKAAVGMSLLPDASHGRTWARRVARWWSVRRAVPRVKKAVTREHHQLTLALLTFPAGFVLGGREDDGLRGLLEEGMRAAKVDPGLLADVVDVDVLAKGLHTCLNREVRAEATRADSRLGGFYDRMCKERQRWVEEAHLWHPVLLRGTVERLLVAIEQEARAVDHLRGLPVRDQLHVTLNVNRSVSVVPRSTGPEWGEASSLSAAWHHSADVMSPDPAMSQDQVVDWAGFADRHSQVMVLADPGMGKTWLVRTETKRLAADALRALRNGGRVDDVVIPVRLRCDELLDAAEDVKAAGDAAGDAVLATAAARVLRDRHPREVRFLERWLARHVTAGGAAVLLDAYDELPGQDQRRRLAELVDPWIGVPAGAAGDGLLAEEVVGSARPRLVITSRVAGYGGPPGERTRLSEVVLTTFDRDDIDAVIDGCGLPAQALRRLRDGMENPVVEGMARVPLLLTMLCVIARDDHSLPRARHELFDRVMRLFLDRDRTGKTRNREPDVDELLVLDVLGTVAHDLATRKNGWSDVMDEETLAVAIETALRNRNLPETPHQVRTRLIDEFGLLVPVARHRDGHPRKYRFLHNTFVEFLAARHLSRQPATEWWSAVRDRIFFDANWERAVPMLGGLLHHPLAPAEPADLVGRLLKLEHDPFHLGLRMAARTVADLPDDAVPAVEGHTDVIVARAARLLRTATREDGVAVLAGLGRRLAGHTGSLLAQLDDPDPDVRCAATTALAGAVTGDEQARRAVLARLDDADPRVKHAAAECLATAVGVPAVRAEFLRALKGEDRYLRRIARRCLADSAATDPRARDGLLTLIADRDPSLRKIAARSLAPVVGADGADNVRTALVGLLGDEHADVRQAAALTLGRGVRRQAGVRDALLAALKDPDQDRDVRLYAAGSLATVLADEPPVRRAFCEVLLNARNNDVRSAAARALRTVAADPAVSEALIKALVGGNSDLRFAAAEVLRDVAGVPTVRARLMELLDRRRTPTSGVRHAAALALRGAVTADRQVQEALVEALDDEKTVRTAAASSLAVNPGMDHETRDALLEILADKDENPYLRLTVLSGLARASAPGGKVREAFLNLLTDRRQDPYVRVPAAEVLRDSVKTDHRVRAVFVDLLEEDDQDPYLALLAVRGLASAVDADERATRALLTALENRRRDPTIREASAASLRIATFDPEVRAALLATLNDKSPEVCRASAKALEGVASEPDVWRALLSVLRHPGHDSTVREAATASLARATTKDPDLRAELLDMFEDENRNLRLSAAEALGPAVVEDAAVRDRFLDALADRDPLIRNTALRLTAKHPVLAEFSTRIIEQWEKLDVSDDLYVFTRYCLLPQLRATSNGLRRGPEAPDLLRSLGEITEHFAREANGSAADAKRPRHRTDAERQSTA